MRLFSPTGTLLRQLEIPMERSAAGISGPVVRVAADGALYQLWTDTEKGLEVRRYDMVPAAGQAAR